MFGGLKWNSTLGLSLPASWVSDTVRKKFGKKGDLDQIQPMTDVGGCG